MNTNKDTCSKVAACLHLLADIIANGKPNEVLGLIEQSLRQTKTELLSRRKSTSGHFRPNLDEDNTVPEQENLLFQKKLSILSVKEFGQDVTSDKSFPTRNDLVKFALSQGVQISQRDTKSTIRKRLLAKAELRNMDQLIDEGKE